jgi:hypothetical protein
VTVQLKKYREFALGNFVCMSTSVNGVHYNVYGIVVHIERPEPRKRSVDIVWSEIGGSYDTRRQVYSSIPKHDTGESWEFSAVPRCQIPYYLLSDLTFRRNEEGDSAPELGSNAIPSLGEFVPGARICSARYGGAGAVHRTYGKVLCIAEIPGAPGDGMIVWQRLRVPKITLEYTRYSDVPPGDQGSGWHFYVI